MKATDREKSIKEIFARALIVKRDLKTIDPWKAIDEVHAANRGQSAILIESAVAKAIKSVRKLSRKAIVRSGL